MCVCVFLKVFKQFNQCFQIYRFLKKKKKSVQKIKKSGVEVISGYIPPSVFLCPMCRKFSQSFFLSYNF